MNNLAWFITPKPAILWIGAAGRAYPHSIELCPVYTKPQADRTRVDIAMAVEANKVMKYFCLNPHYYTIDISIKWSQL